MFGKKRETNVLVVGAGPVGLFAALQLARHGIGVRVVDEQWRTAARSYALALHPRSLELFEELGLAEGLIDRGHRVEAIALYEGSHRRAVFEYSLLPSRHPFLLILPQNELEGVLEARLREEGVEVLWNHRLAGLSTEDDRVEARVERLAKESTGYSVAATEWVVQGEQTVSADFVLGADGHRSLVRRALGIDFPDLGRTQLFAVFECDTDEDSPSEARIFFSGDSTNVLWPLPGRGLRWSFELTEKDESHVPRRKSRLAVEVGGRSYPHLTPEALDGFIADRAPWFDGKIRDVRWSLEIRFERRLATHFGKGSVLLAGDAAHMAGPIGMHSMNMGLREAHGLSQGIGSALGKVGDRESLRATLEQNRNEWQRLLGQTATVHAALDADPWVTKVSSLLPACVPATGPDLDRLLASVGLSLD